MLELRITGSNQATVTVGPLDFFFSYSTCIAFYAGRELVICENVWSRTTGRHLNEINPDKSIRIPRDEFMERLGSLTASIKVKEGE